MKYLRQSLLALLIVIIGVATAFAQTSNGTVIGVITDPTGRAIVGATVTLTSPDTGIVRTTKTNSEGTYRIESVLPGVYDVSATSSGFQTTINKGLQVPGTAIVTSSMVLQIGKTADQVEVLADTAVMNIDNGQIEGSIGEQEISSLPIPSLNPYELALTLPGVTSTTQGGFSNGVSYNVGGGRPRANNFLIEGQDNNDAGITGQGLQPINDEAIKEVVILENAYTAEYGHGAGSVSNMIFRSGTNQFHGAIYERLQNSSLDAIDKMDHFYNVTQFTKYRENMPGFRVGGPIIHNKLFFFGSYQWDFYRSSANLNVLTVPTANGFATLNNFSTNPRVANLIKAYGGLKGVVNAQDTRPAIPLGLDPVTGLDRGTVEMGTVQRNLGAAYDSPELELKSDYIINEKDTLTLRMIRNSFTAPYDVWNAPGQLPGFDSNQGGVAYNNGIVETHVFSPEVVNEIRMSYGRIGFTFGLPASTTSNPLYNQPAVSVAEMTGYGIPGAIPQGRFHNTYQLQDTVSWTKGKHFIKIGMDLSNTRVRDLIPFNYYGAMSYATDTRATKVNGQSVTYTGLANLLDDFGGPSATITQNFGSPTARPQLYSQNYFAQDTYRPITNLSIDLGFRYEYNGAPFNAPGTKYPALDMKDIACYPLAAGAQCNTRQQADGSQWGPRLGIAYSPTVFGTHKSVIRSGFGIFYDVVYTNIIDNIQATAPNNASPLITSIANATNTRGTSAWSTKFASLVKTPTATNTAEPIASHLLSPRTMHWNLNLEQELPWQTTLQVGYVGERGVHLYGNTNLNPFVNQYETGARVIPTRGSIILRDNSGDSQYAGLWSELDHKFNHNFLFRASYTLGHSFDDVSEIFTFNNQSSYQFSRYPTPRGRTDWGPSAYDHRQRLVLSYIWTPGVWHTEGSMKLLGNLVNRWSFAGITQFQTGSPQNVEVGTDVDGDGIGNDRPMVGNKSAPLNTYAFDDAWYYGTSQGGLCSGPSLWYTNLPCESVPKDTVHWIVPAYGTYPAQPIGRNSLISPGLQTWDMNIQRSFKLTERVTMDFRGELMNAFNHGNADVNSMSSTLISGIPTDAYSNNGTNVFYDPAPAVTGHRHARIFVKVSF